MRARIKVMDLTRGQWDWLQANLPESYHVPDTSVRVCVELELDAELHMHHLEMSVRSFVALMSQLQLVESVRNQVDPARLPVLPTADEVRRLSAADAVELTRRLNDGRTCQHGSPVVSANPSVFEDAEPVRTFEDGCQSYGPYGK
jgi:hypothetical protein